VRLLSEEGISAYRYGCDDREDTAYGGREVASGAVRTGGMGRCVGTDSDDGVVAAGAATADV
jgi:hypothetical protein